MIHPTMTKQLKLQFIPRVLGSKTRTLEFIDACCINYVEHFDANGTTCMTISLEITSTAVKDSNSNTEFSEYWRTTFPIKVPVTEREEKKPTFIGYHFEDNLGEIVEQNKINVGDEIYLIVETKNATGEETTIDLADKSIDYEYQGKPLKNDILKGIIIQGDISKYKLKAISQQKEV